MTVPETKQEPLKCSSTPNVTNKPDSQGVMFSLAALTGGNVWPELLPRKYFWEESILFGENIGKVFQFSREN